MNKFPKIIYPLLMMFIIHSGWIEARPSSYPYIAGDTFRDFCDYVYDETGNTVIPENVNYGDSIFVCTDFIGSFFSMHEKIASPYVLVTHNGDREAPGGYAHMLDDPKILAWYGQNVTYKHPKLHPIPIGIANRHWLHGRIEIVSEVQAVAQNIEKSYLLFMNFSQHTNFHVRSHVYNLFHDKPFCFVSGIKDFKSYLLDLCKMKFVLSPRGNGLDCHRTWETLLLGAIPIVTTSTIDSLYDGLPVIIIHDWTEVTEEFLENKWLEMSQMEFQHDRMYAGYWLDQIASHKQATLPHTQILEGSR